MQRRFQRAVPQTCLALLFTVLAGHSPAGASTGNDPTPYFKCMGWLDRNDVHQFRLCFYREMEALVGGAARAHNAVLADEGRLRALPRDAANSALFASESCSRSREIAGAIIASIRNAGAARASLVDAAGLLRTMHGQITQHASFRMPNRAMVRDEVSRVGATHVDRIERGIQRVAAAEEGFRAMRVADRCRGPEPALPSAEYEDNVNYVGNDLRAGFPTQSVQACHWYCSNNAQCRAFTYVRGSGGGTCWLKSVAANRYRDPCCVSKVVR